MSAKHTPGPWVADRLDFWTVRVLDREDGPSDFLALKVLSPGDEAEANARLMAAAPDLLDALLWVLPEPADCERCKRSGGPCVGHAAIAKANPAAPRP